MRKILWIATISLGTLLLTAPLFAEDSEFTASQDEHSSQDWYNQKLAGAVDGFQSGLAALTASRGESDQLASIAQQTQPENMAANAGEDANGQDMYSQTISAEFQVNRLNEVGNRTPEQQYDSSQSQDQSQ